MKNGYFKKASVYLKPSQADIIQYSVYGEKESLKLSMPKFIFFICVDNDESNNFNVTELLKGLNI